MLKAMMDSPISWAILAVCTVIGVFSFIYTLATIKKQRITYAKSDYNFISLREAFSDDVQVLYQGQNIKNLTISNIAVWNSGNDTIDQNSFVSKKPLRLSLSNGGEIIDATILCETDADNAVKIQNRTDTSITLTMDYINPKDGVVIQILHTGERMDLKIDGKLKTGKPLKEYDYLPVIRKLLISRPIAKRISSITLCVLAVFMIMLLITSSLAQFGILPSEYLVSKNHLVRTTQDIVNEYFVLSIIYSAMFLPLIYIVLRIDHKYGIPQKLKSFTNFE